MVFEVNDEFKRTIELFRIALQDYLISNNISISSDFNNSDCESIFPKNSCKGSSYMLGQYLIDEQNIAENIIYYVWGTNENNETHGWLEIEEWIIDITADQFSTENPSVMIVGKDKSRFHENFKKQEQDLCKMKEVHEFNDIIEEIVRLIKRKSR